MIGNIASLTQVLFFFTTTTISAFHVPDKRRCFVNTCVNHRLGGTRQTALCTSSRRAEEIIKTVFNRCLVAGRLFPTAIHEETTRRL
ncbi:hypothetical protein H4582DRAFT_463842 [Lactarius indigo]|nr:hypothetical protein H4582DRAFT_463842 [Lactarius indigo]